MKKLSAIAVCGAVALAGAPALAQETVPTEPITLESSPIIAPLVESSGDAEVKLLTTRSAPVVPGFENWILLEWMDLGTDAREFRVTADADGAVVGYPENTVDHSSLYWDDSLIPGEVDYTALQLTIDPAKAGAVMLDVTLSYVSDSGPVTIDQQVEVPIDNGTSDGGLTYSDGSLGSVEVGGAAWFGQSLAADTDVSSVTVEVVDDSGFDVSYPSEDSVSRPENGTTLVSGSSDVARIQFDSNDMDAGTYSVTMAVSYYVGSQLKTDYVQRQITVGDEAPVTTTTTAPTTTTTEAPTTTAPPTTQAPTTTTVHVPTELLAGMDNAGWSFDPDGTDNAKKGKFELAMPQLDQWSGFTNQPAGTPSGDLALVTRAKSSKGSGKYDIDGGKTSAMTAPIALPEGVSSTLELAYYFSYLSNSSSADYLKITIIGESGSAVVLDERGAAANRDAVWTNVSFDLSDFAGENIQILVEAADESTGSLVEAAVTDISIIG